MSVLSAVAGASSRKKIVSESQRAWDALSSEEREAIRETAQSGTVGTGKLSDVLKAEGCPISKYFLDQLLAGEKQ